MFERWRQENFFKYLREEYALDALVDYQVEPDDPEREVPNPARQASTTKLRQARAELAGLEAKYGLAAFVNPEGVRVAPCEASRSRTPRSGDDICAALHRGRKTRARVGRRCRRGCPSGRWSTGPS